VSQTRMDGASVTALPIQIEVDDLIVEEVRAPDQSVIENDRGVRITHTPTGLIVTFVEYRSQLENKAAALQALRRALVEDGFLAARALLEPQPQLRPEIVCLCGSTRFYDAFQQANYDLTMEGKIVLSVGFYPHAKAEHGHGEGVGHDPTEKAMLDELHKRKIDLADRILVLNVGGYIGESTRSEIEYAEQHGTPVAYLEH
jgi:hypothetical protein